VLSHIRVSHVQAQNDASKSYMNTEDLSNVSQVRYHLDSSSMGASLSVTQDLGFIHISALFKFNLCTISLAAAHLVVVLSNSSQLMTRYEASQLETACLTPAKVLPADRLAPPLS
jgi:ABC-type protease/lipase transport system fused ATPase/permease subunit